MTTKTVVVKFLGDDASLKKTLGSVHKDAEKTGLGFGSLLKGVAGVVGVVGALDLAKDAAGEVVDEFSNLEDANASLANAMKDAGEKGGAGFQAGLARAQDANEKLGFAASDTTNALAALRVAGISTTEGMANMPAVADLAAHAHITLAEAAVQVVKATQGSAKALKDLNVAMPTTLPTMAKLTSAQEAYNAALKAHGPHAAATIAAHKKLLQVTADLADRTKNFTAITGLLEGKLKGQAASAADTLSGRLNVLKTEAIDTGAKLLKGLTPALTWMVGILSDLVGWLSVAIPAALKVITPIFQTVFGAIVAFFHSGAWTAIQNVFKVIFAVWLQAWKVIIAAVTTEVKIIIAIFQGIVAFFRSGAFKVIATIVAAPFRVAVAVIGLIVLGIIAAVKGVVAFFHTGAWAVISTILAAPFKLAIGVGSTVVGWIGDLVTTFKGLPGLIGGALAGIFNFVTAPFKLAFNFIASLWNNTLGKIHFTIPGWVPGIGNDSFGFPTIPTFHTGGTVPGPQGTAQMALLLAGERVQSPSEVRGGRGGLRPIDVHVTTNADPAEIGREVAWAAKTAMAT